MPDRLASGWVCPSYGTSWPRPEYPGVLATKALDLAELEHHASHVRTFQSSVPQNLRWQKSSFSAGDYDDCPEIAATPTALLTPTPIALDALLTAVKAAATSRR